MSYKSYLVNQFENTAEREIFDKINNLLFEEYKNEEDLLIFIGNISCNGKEIDGIIIKSDCITVLDFKNYGGTLEFSENGDWLMDGIVVKGGAGNKNPYRQIKENKFALLNTLNILLNLPNVNLGHITAIVLFHKKISFDDQTIPPKIKSWLYVIDVNNLLLKVRQITSRQIKISNKEKLYIIERLNIKDKLHAESDFYDNAEVDTSEFVKSEEKLIANPAIKETIENRSILEDEIKTLGFKVSYKLILPERQAKYLSASELNASVYVNKYLNKYNSKLYEHQYKSFISFANGNNVCVSTSTSSGKSDIFFIIGIELLSKNKDAKIIAVYPLKALGNQQENRWREALKLSGIEINIGRIDGSIDVNERKSIIEKSSIIIITPDVIHSWLLMKLDDRSIQNYLSTTRLIILDEAHTYTGVFGSNSAFLFRRLNHAIYELSKNLPQYLSASATLENPEQHLNDLIGLDFEIVDSTSDSSGKHKINLLMIDSYDPKDVVNKMIELLKYLKNTNHKYIAFLDSRKMVEQVADIVNKVTREDVNDSDIEDDVYPYRSGYERNDADKIQELLSASKLKGVISTSALELGIDVKGLDVGILFGVPTSATSFYQRVGRVGRHKEGYVIIINDHSVRSETVFNKPHEIMNMPVAECPLYLENEYIQYIHTLCFASNDQEYDKISNSKDEFRTSINFPETFIEKCIDERNGQVPHHLQNLKTSGFPNPHFNFPLRDLGVQYKVIEKNRGYENPKGSLSHSQLMREAYPHAIYYYLGRQYRVKKVLHNVKKVEVYQTSHVSTKPIFAPTLIFPNFSDNIFSADKCGNIVIVEANLQISESVIGLKENRGGKDTTINYPFSNNRESYSGSRFSRNIFTTGILLFHPEFEKQGIQLDLIASRIKEIFLILHPLESQDIGFGVDKIRSEYFQLPKGSKFICLFDQTYGSLRLTSKLTDTNNLRKIISMLLELSERIDEDINDEQKLNTLSIEALKILYTTLREENPYSINDTTRVSKIEDGFATIILPYTGFNIGTGDWEKSKGININRNGEEFYIKNIIFKEVNGSTKIFYRGCYESQKRVDPSGNLIFSNSNPAVDVPYDVITPFGGSKLAIYDYAEQNITPSEEN